jgi:hypothetical protein
MTAASAESRFNLIIIYRGHWNILYPELDWGGRGSNYERRMFQSGT